MAYLFIDDNSPEADEYVSNYIYFDEKDLKSLERALRIAGERKIKCSNSPNNTTLQNDIYPAFSSAETLR